ncbi:hypothetical protein MNAN1_002753 [Malassezia nana]|uniref:PNPLA domain-containing protein n=1 Tax=Malassezia nana TaxID=180528 RepID=A0AAF0ELV9_9BASI|nr:hypothetical protein MNAN1_002753 [Malassezia nana]
MFSILRWPILWLVFTLIFTDFSLYVLVRQIVNVMETIIAWNGYSGVLRNKMRSAQTYPDWKRAALEFDEYRKYNVWKENNASPFYDWRLVERIVSALRGFRKSKDAYGIMSVLNLCLRHGFAGMENRSLYSQSFYGTKRLIEEFYDEVDGSLSDFESSDLPPHIKGAFYAFASKNLGRSALCLSGGASFAYYHFGVVRTLLDGNLLPNIISGTSAGGLVAALVCTRTNEELKELLVPELARHITGCDDPMYVWMYRMFCTGARFDAIKWARQVQFFTRGSMTFREAFERTGKILNISVVPFDQHSPAQLLNYVTAPDCLIWSAVLASAAVPGILNPVFLMQKMPDGSVEPWSWGNKFRDGSLRVDIPLETLHSMFNVTYPIVSQVNPHVHLFHFGSRGAPGRPTAYREGRGWRGGFLLSAAEHVLKLNLLTNFRILKDLDLLPKMLGQDWSNVFLQSFEGTVTIYPKSRILDWPRILTDPSPGELARMMRAGQYVTFPKLHMLSNRLRIERAIGRGFANYRVHASDTDTDDSDYELPKAMAHTQAWVLRGAGQASSTPLESHLKQDAQEELARRDRRALADLEREELYELLEEFEASQDMGLDEAAQIHSQRPVIPDSDEEMP